MAKLESSFKNMALVLCGIAVFAAGSLGLVYDLTLDPIKAADLAKQEAAVREVAPNFNNEPIKEKYFLLSPEGDSLACFPAKKDGKLTGVAIESFSKKGFHGEIRVMVGLDPQGRIVNYNVIKHAETPGLGSKMDEWFKTDKNRQNIIGLDPGKNKVWVSKDGGDVDGITAATISSRAFLDAIDRAYRAYMASIDVNLDARTSASAQKIQKDTTVRSVVKTVVPKVPAAQKKKAEFGKKKTKTPVKEEPVKNTEEPKKEEVDGQSSASATY